MKKSTFSILFFILLMFVANADDVFVVNSTSATLSRIDTESGTVDNDYIDLGVSPNLIDVADGFAYVVNSGDNSVQKINLESGVTVSNIYVADSCNPWSAKVNNGHLYVTGLLTNKLYKIDLETENLVAEVVVGNSPEGIAFYNDKIFVGITGGYENNYQGSQVTVVEDASFSVIEEIETSLNTQYVHVYNNKLYAMCTGNWSDVSGVITVIDLDTYDVITNINIGGNIGKSAFIGNKGYITDGMNAGIFVIDTDTDTIINDSTNPLTPGGSTIATNGVSVAYINASWGSNGTVWITDNNLENGVSYEVALAPVDIIFSENAVPNVDSEVEVVSLNVSCYPNPTRKDINFEIHNASKGMNKIEIYNIKGQMVNEFDTSSTLIKWNGLDSNNQTTASGIYFYKISNSTKTKNGKFIKLK